MHSSEQNVPRWLPTHRSGTCRDDFINEMTLYKSEQTYFAEHLLHGCRRTHQELIPSYPALPVQFRIFFDAKLLNRCFASPYQRLVIYRPLLSSEYCSEETNHKASWLPPGTLYYRPVPSLYSPMSHGGDCLSDCLLFLCLIFRTPTIYDHTSHLFHMGGRWLILGYVLLCRINLHTVFRYSYVCYFLVVWPLVSMGESE